MYIALTRNQKINMNFLFEFSVPKNLESFDRFSVPANQFYNWWLTVPEIHDKVYLRSSWTWVKGSNDTDTERNYHVSIVEVIRYSDLSKWDKKQNDTIISWCKFLYEEDIDIDWIRHICSENPTKEMGLGATANVRFSKDSVDWMKFEPADWYGLFVSTWDKKPEVIRIAEIITKNSEFSHYALKYYKHIQNWVIYFSKTPEGLPVFENKQKSKSSIKKSKPTTEEEEIKAQIEALQKRLKMLNNNETDSSQ